MKVRLRWTTLAMALLCMIAFMQEGCARQNNPQNPQPGNGQPAPGQPAPGQPPGTPANPGTTPAPGGGTNPPTGGTNPPTGGTTQPPTGGTTPTTPPTTGGTTPQDPPPALGRTPFELQMDEAMLGELNRRRAAKGAGPVTLHNALVTTAVQHSQDEGQRNYFSSTNPEGKTLDARCRANGFPSPAYSVVGKNTEAPWNPKDPAGMAGFMLGVYEGQPANRDRLYNPQFNRVGIGTFFRDVPAYTAGKTTYNTLCFGTIQ